MVGLGDEVKDKVTGFKGIAVGITIFLQGCRRISVQPPVGKDGILPDQHWFDEPQLDVIKVAKVKTEDVTEKKRPGGAMHSIPTRNMPEKR